MKTQLLHDLDESRVDFAAAPAARPAPLNAQAAPVAPTEPVAATVTAAPTAPAAPAAAPPTPAYAAPRAAVWSFKERASAPQAVQAMPEPAGSTPPAAPDAIPAPEAAFTPPPAKPAAASFAPSPDDVPPLDVPDAIIWPSQQGRAQEAIEQEQRRAARVGKAQRVSVALVMLAVLGAGGYWFYHERKIDNTMALLATKASPAPSALIHDSAPRPPQPAQPAQAAAPAATSLGSEALSTPEARPAPPRPQ